MKSGRPKALCSEEIKFNPPNDMMESLKVLSFSKGIFSNTSEMLRSKKSH